MMKKMIASLALLAATLFSLSAKSITIGIRNPSEFNAVCASVQTALKGGYDDITVRFDKRVFYFNENHFNLVNLKYPGVKLTFDGGGATLIGAGYDLNASRKKKNRYVATWFGYNWREGIIDLDNLADVRPFGPLRQSKGKIEIVNAASGLCRMPSDEADLRSPAGMYIQFSSWYQGLIYPVTKIEKGYIYFTVNNLTKNGGYYNIEGDRQYAGMNPKYQLINDPSAEVWWSGGKLRFKKKGHYHVCLASEAIVVGDCHLKGLEFKNFNFLGNSDSAEILMHVYRTVGPVSVNHCSFRGIRNLVISSVETSGASYNDNIVEGCYRGFLRLFRESVGTQVCRNVMRDNQLLMNNYFQITCRGKNFTITDNVISDFTYGAIGLGDHFTVAGGAVCSGVVEGNEIYYTEEYRKAPSRTLMDSGAIYCWTQQQNVVIKNNYIHDYTGTKDNRGIFGDDGTCNTTVTGNRILRIGNSYCIDFRRVSSVETMSNSSVKKTNVGIKMSDNIIDGKVRFEPRSGDKTSRKGTNKVL